MERIPYTTFAGYYDLGWGDFAESTRGFVETTIANCGIERGKILELACGTGILALHLARCGHTVLGVDQSPNMIAIARSKARYEKGVEFELGDMRKAPSQSGFDGATCIFDSINYLTTLEDVAALFRVVAAALRADGVFIFDFNRPLIYSAHDGETLRRCVEDGILIQELAYDVVKKQARTIFRFPDGDVETHVQRAYEMEEMLPLLQAAGLTVTECYAGFDRRTVCSLSERIVCVCRKRLAAQTNERIGPADA